MIDIKQYMQNMNVPIPTCNVTFAILTPFSSIFFNNSGVKCSPAVGAAAEPSDQ